MEQKTESRTAVTVRPADDELGMFGITHPGLERPENQDYFLLATVHPQVVVHGSSLGGVSELPLRGSRLGTVLLVADGVGGSSDGGAAALLATESVTQYVASSLRCYHEIGAGQKPEFLTASREAVLRAHDAVRAEAATRAGNASLATTLTLGIGVWPCRIGKSIGVLEVCGGMRSVRSLRRGTWRSETLRWPTLCLALLLAAPSLYLTQSFLAIGDPTPANLAVALLTGALPLTLLVAGVHRVRTGIGGRAAQLDLLALGGALQW